MVKVSLQAADDISEAYEIFVPPVEPSVAAAATYSRPRPVKTKRPLDKPEQIELIAHDGFRVFEARGIWFREWQVKEAANRFDDGNVVPGYYQKEVYAETLTKFPISYKDLLQYDVIVFTNVSATCLNEVQGEMLKDFVEAGGGLLALGGRFAFGGGNYKGSALEALLPVESGASWDVKEAEGPLFLRPVKKARLGATLDWQAGPIIPFYQLPGVLKTGTQLLLRAGDEPFLAVHTVGKGKTAAIMATVEGAGADGKPAFFEWEHWPELLSEILRLLQEGNN